MDRKARRRHQSSSIHHATFAFLHFFTLKESVHSPLSPVNRRSIRSLAPPWTAAAPPSPRWTGLLTASCLCRSTAMRNSRFQWSRRRTRERSLGSTSSQLLFNFGFVDRRCFFYSCNCICFLFGFLCASVILLVV